MNYFDTRRRNEDPQVDQRENRRRRVENDIQGTNENLIQRTEASSYRADGDFLGGNEFRPLGSLNSWDVTQ